MHMKNTSMRLRFTHGDGGSGALAELKDDFY